MSGNCTFYLRSSPRPPNLSQIKDKIISGTIDQKVNHVIELIKCIIADQTYPTIIMTIINHITPFQQKSPSLRKAMLLYWEVIEKSKAPNDPTLKEEVFLACNSLRIDLYSHNQYLRGRTLRLVSRIMHRGVIEPLAGAIADNLKHKSSYVRRNAVVCTYNVFINFGSDIIGDIEDQIETLLRTETDLSTKRNAFILLNKTNNTKAMNYITNKIKNQAVQEIGDILQLSILKIFKLKCREDPNQKPRLLKIISDFQQKAQESVLLECAITSIAISNSASTIKNSLHSYVNILANTNEINVKKIILDKLQTICHNSNYLEQNLVEDLLHSLQTPSLQIKKKVFDIIMSAVTAYNVANILKKLSQEVHKQHNMEYTVHLIWIIRRIAMDFKSVHPQILDLFKTKLIGIEQLAIQAINPLNDTLRFILMNSQKNNQLQNDIIISFHAIKSIQLMKCVLNALTNYLQDTELIISAIDSFKIAIGNLPLSSSNLKHHKNKTEDDDEEPKKVFKTIILEDGTYSTEIVSEKNFKQQVSYEQEMPYFRNGLLDNSVLGGVLVRTLGKLIYKIRKTQYFNKYACSILMILCSLLRHYQSHLIGVDQAIIDQITIVIRELLNPQKFISTDNGIFEIFSEPLAPQIGVFQAKKQMIEKNPQDSINFRLLKKNVGQIPEFDFDEDQVNDLTEQQQQTQTLNSVSQLRSYIQLTGPFDVIFVEAYLHVNRYDVFMEITMQNQHHANCLNVQIEFTSSVQILVLEKAQAVNLRSKQTVSLRCHLRFTGTDFGVIYGYVNYDNQSGLQQPYLITQQIKIDCKQFIEPAHTSQTIFKMEWQKLEQQCKVEKVIKCQGTKKFTRIINQLEKHLKSKKVNQIQEDQQQYFMNQHLFGKSKLGQNFLINLALFGKEQITIIVTIKSKEIAVQNILMKLLETFDFIQDD